MPEENQENRSSDFINESEIEQGVGVEQIEQSGQNNFALEKQIEFTKPQQVEHEFGEVGELSEQSETIESGNENSFEIPADAKHIAHSGEDEAVLVVPEVDHKDNSSAHVIEKLLDHNLDLEAAFADQEAVFNFNQEQSS